MLKINLVQRDLFFLFNIWNFASLTQAFSILILSTYDRSIRFYCWCVRSLFYFFPKAKVLVLIPFFIFFTVKVPAYILLIFWFLYQFLNLSNVDSSVAWLAHIGGFIFGYFFAVFSKSYNVGSKGKTVLLDKDEKGPWD